MPPKSKQGKAEWVQCDKCLILLLKKDQDDHARECQIIRTENALLGQDIEADDSSEHHLKCEDNQIGNTPDTKSDVSCRSLNHPYICNGEINTNTFLYSENIDTVPRKWLNCLILLHPTTMTVCDIGIGDYALLHINQHGNMVGSAPQCFTVWPSSTIPLSSVGILPETSLQAKMPVRVHVHRGKKKHAKIATLNCIKGSVSYEKKEELADCLKDEMSSRLWTVGNIIELFFYGRILTFCVKSLSLVADEETDHALPVVSFSDNFYKIYQKTMLTVEGLQKVNKITKKTTLPRENFAGYEEIKKSLESIVHRRLKENCPGRECLPLGIILHGASGTGKTLLVETLSSQAAAHVVSISGHHIWSRFYGESEAKLAKLFDEARENQPSIILLDDVHSLCPRKANSDVEKRLVASLVTLLDNVNCQDLIVVIATTSRIDEVDRTLRRAGRFDKELELPVPSCASRLAILSSTLQRYPRQVSDDTLRQVADAAHGFVGADLAALCREAFLLAAVDEENQAGDKAVSLSNEDLQLALARSRPSMLRDVSLDIPDVHWSDVGGQSSVKQQLKQAIEWPLRYPEAFQRLGITPPRGLLMYGPPGCSKTLIAKALACESKLNFISVKGPELLSKWVGDSEKAVRDIFYRARQASPAIIFFDEIDALGTERSSGPDVANRVLTQLLTEMDGLSSLKDVCIVAATNRPDSIDKALMRPGRLDRVVYVPLPDLDTRKEIFDILFRKTPVADNVLSAELALRTEGYSGAEVTAVCQEAVLTAMDENIDVECIQKCHFDAALALVTPRTSAEQVTFYKSYHAKFGVAKPI